MAEDLREIYGCRGKLIFWTRAFLTFCNWCLIVIPLRGVKVMSQENKEKKFKDNGLMMKIAVTSLLTALLMMRNL